MFLYAHSGGTRERHRRRRAIDIAPGCGYCATYSSPSSGLRAALAGFFLCQVATRGDVSRGSEIFANPPTRTVEGCSLMFSVGHVEGGTGAGRKRPLKAAPKHWACNCRSARAVAAGATSTVVQPGYMSRCFNCGMRRPE